MGILTRIQDRPFHGADDLLIETRVLGVSLGINRCHVSLLIILVLVLRRILIDPKDAEALLVVVKDFVSLCYNDTIMEYLK